MTEKKLTEESCGEFTRMLASSLPAPGGGAAAALCGALAASLCSMSAKLSLGKARYAQLEDLILSTDEKAEKLRERFMELIELDKEAFLPLKRAYSIDKAELGRGEILREASLAACAPAVEMLILCSETVELLYDMDEVNNPMLISDVGCGAALCAGAMEAAAMNVLINTRGFKGDTEAEKLRGELRVLLDEYLPRARELSAKITERLECDGNTP